MNIKISRLNNLVRKLIVILSSLIFVTTIIFIAVNVLLGIAVDSGLIGAYTNLLVFNATLFTPIAAYFFYDNWKDQRTYENTFSFANATYLYLLELDISLKELNQYFKLISFKEQNSNSSYSSEIYKNFNASELLPLMVKCSKLSYTVLVHIERLEHEMELEKFSNWHSDLLFCSNIPSNIVITDQTKRNNCLQKYKSIQNSTEDIKNELNRIISNLDKKSPTP
ncbi:hypothetical protein SOI76_14850 [Acinetobacter pittii]|uniref:hypothetical protein n=1 Tax=Acinetobacter pittii TaxID=48296 RepID=UPI000CE54560|nr:hypothetical protein [Acinetobacter pittii]PPC04604.1 hypothetical protein ApiMCR8900_12540 [Acinetobacter pittii]WPP58696.1 hypothetical protein SOI76_14850 [Acinetobacter pittii]